MPNAEKTESVEELKERFDGLPARRCSPSTAGLTVRQLSDLRKQLKGASAEYKVVKNRLARIAVKDSRSRRLAQHLKGPTGVAYHPSGSGRRWPRRSRPSSGRTPS